MSPEQEERLVAAFESLAETFDFMAGTMEKIGETLEKHHQRTFPERKPAPEATITHVQTEEERLREEQGASNEDLGDWTRIGPREAKYLEEHGPENPDKEPET